MSVLRNAILRAKGGFEFALNSIAPMATITYVGTGETRQVRAFEPGRQDVPLTGGQVQEDRAIKLSSSQLAATNPPREIRKNDVIELVGKKYAVQSAVQVEFDAVNIAWLLEVRG